MYYTKQELLQLIFKELRKFKPTAGYWWQVQHFIRFMNSLPKPIEYGDFIALMQEICKDGIFTVAEINKIDGEILTFELTEKGAQLLWCK